jgi:hypothetical protein
MMPDRAERRWEAYSPEDRRVIAEVTGGSFVSAGQIPEGHEGVYRPSHEELIEGARRIAEESVRFAELTTKLAIEQAEKHRVDEPEDQG